MKVVIAGAGSVGRSVAKELTHAGHDITIVDKQPSAMKIASVPEADWILADAQEDGAASRKIREGRQRGTEGAAGVLGECHRLDLKAVAAIQCQTSESFREVSQIDNHMSIVHEMSMKGPRVSMKCR